MNAQSERHLMPNETDNIDREVAEKVMGWKPHQIGPTTYLTNPDNGSHHCGPDPYSTDISAAMKVVESLRTRGKFLDIFPIDEGYEVKLAGAAIGIFARSLESLPLAICQAALAAVAAKGKK